jgi:hypothetical protein
MMAGKIAAGNYFSVDKKWPLHNLDLVVQRPLF